ncbi:hypothetical protein BRARA_B00963 [Brassica rapa]|uniref:GRF-type domain-containing protein n=1 Tax=Brassica campestris TaxID=3711 RepID=A0A398AEV6_BRACM|nr:hypothetical protein BRARA_B00963 [Brassica rapa]
MSNESGASSGTSGVRRRGTVVGVPKRCWCGEIMVARMSKSEANPYRRYYRCAYAVERKLSNDNHSYKWVDEALADEIEILGMRTERLEQQNPIANLCLTEGSSTNSPTSFSVLKSLRSRRFSPSES